MSDAIQILDALIGDDPEMREMIARERLSAKIGQLIYDARQAAGLTQQQLADKAQTRQPVIARLENADYEGHSLKMLHRIARALGQELEIQFVTPRAQSISASPSSPKTRKGRTVSKPAAARRKATA